MESSHPDQPGLGNQTSRAAGDGEFHPLDDPCTGVIWRIPQIHTDQSRFFLCDTEQFPCPALEKDRGEAPICTLHEAPQIKTFCSSNSHITGTQKFWCFTLKRNPNELSRSLSHQFSSSLQTLKRLAHTWRIYICMTPFSKRNTLQQQQKNRSLLRLWNPQIKLQLLQNLILTGATSTRCQRKPHSVWATLVFPNK